MNVRWRIETRRTVTHAHTHDRATTDRRRKKRIIKRSYRGKKRRLRAHDIIRATLLIRTILRFSITVCCMSRTRSIWSNRKEEKTF